MMIKHFKNLYLPIRFFLAIGLIISVFILSFPFPFFFEVGQVMIVIFCALCIVDTILLFWKKEPVFAERKHSKLLSLGSQNKIEILIINSTNFNFRTTLIDELPFQLQKRDFAIHFVFKAQEYKKITYLLRPTERGKYQFGSINVFLRSTIGLVERRIFQRADKIVPVYPSIIEMNQFELKSLRNIAFYYGIKKMRRLGHSYEFEQIKEYVKGDDYQSINWKATSRAQNLMVNHYEDEKSQQVYSLIDKSRAMKMPFLGLSLLDYAINTSLVISNVALAKQDKAGLITFSDSLGSTIPAESNKKHLKLILETLYKEQEGRLEANYELLYRVVRNFIRGRSLIFLYTNFESSYSLERVLPIIRKINQRHLLVVVLFENTEIKNYSHEIANNLKELYFKTIAQKFLYEKHQIMQQLRQYGVQTILTQPQNLSINTVNKYLELKAKGLI